MEKFLYVFSQEDKLKLQEAGFAILKEDEASNVYVFLNQPCLTFSLADSTFVKSNTLTF